MKKFKFHLERGEKGTERREERKSTGLKKWKGPIEKGLPGETRPEGIEKNSGGK